MSQYININVNRKTGLYEVTEGDTLYLMDFVMKEKLKFYIRHAVPGPDHPVKSIAAWYNDLSKEDRINVTVVTN